MKAYPRDDGLEHLNRQVAAVIDYCRGDRGLDVGCGFYKIHPGSVGLDRNPCTGADIIADGRRLPFPDESFDYVASIHSFLEMWEPEGTIREWVRVIKPGGHRILLIEDKRHLPPLGHPAGNPRYHYLFTPEELCQLLARFPCLDPIEAFPPEEGIFAVVCRKKPRKSYRILFCCDLLRVSTGDYFVKALEELGHQVVTAGQGRDLPRAGEVALVDLLREAAEVGFVPDLVIEHESGTVLSTKGKPSGLPVAWIEVDATTHHAGHAIRARDFDCVFTMQPAFVDYFRRHGNPRTYPLPAACDPQVHRPVPAAEVYDLGFVGSTFLPYYEERVRYLERLRSRFSVAFTSALYDDMNLAFTRCTWTRRGT